MLIPPQKHLVLEVADIKAALSVADAMLFAELVKKVDGHRAMEGKPPFACVVVEKGWPEYEPVHHSLELRAFVKEQLQLSTPHDVMELGSTDTAVDPRSSTTARQMAAPPPLGGYCVKSNSTIRQIEG